MSLPIRGKLTLWYAGSLTVLIGLFGVLIDGLMHERLLARTDFELDEELHELALETGLARDRDQLLRQLHLRFGSHETFEFVVQTPAGKCVFASPRMTNISEALPLTRAGADVAYRNVTLEGLGSCRIGTEPATGPEGPLSIAVIMPLGRYVAELRDLRLLLVTVGPLVVLIAIAGGYWLSWRSLRPVDRMTAAAARISAENGSERLQVANPGDELGRLAVTLNAMIDRLQKSLDEMRQFTADAAHELRTPLAVIRSAAEVALRNPRPAEYYEDALQGIAEEAERLTHLSDQLLLLAREDAGLNHGMPEPLDLGQLAQTAAADLEPLAEQKGLTLTCEVHEPAYVLGDAERLRRVFVNLLDNAVKYTEPGGRIDVAVAARSDSIEVTFRDTGIGIAPEHLPRIFDRFYRADPSHNRETGGTGLGLAICRAIVASHGGTLSIESEEGAGTEVRIVLPAWKNATGTPGAPSFSATPAQSPRRQSALPQGHAAR